MGLRVLCDWCGDEPTPKLRLPEQRITLPKYWRFTMLEMGAKEGEVIVSCGKKCRRRLSEVHDDIKKARADRRDQEEKKKKKRLGF